MPLPLSTKVTPEGSVPVSLSAGVGNPVVVTVNVLGRARLVNVVASALVIAGGLVDGEREALGGVGGHAVGGGDRQRVGAAGARRGRAGERGRAVAVRPRRSRPWAASRSRSVSGRDPGWSSL